MNELVLWVFVIWFIIRVAGLVTCIEFFKRKRNSKEIYLIVSWAVSLPQNILAIYLLFMGIADDILFLYCLISVVLYYFLDILGITRYYHDVNEKKASFILIIMIISILLAFLIEGYDTARFISNIFMLGIQGYMIITPLINFKEFKSKIRTSGKWYFITFISSALLIPIVIYTTSLGYAWGVTDAESIFIIFLFYIPVIISHVFLIIFIVHVEYISTIEQKDDLKDKFSHDLGNIMQALYFIEHIIENEGEFENFENKLEIFKTKLEEASKLITEIREL